MKSIIFSLPDVRGWSKEDQRIERALILMGLTFWDIYDEFRIVVRDPYSLAIQQTGEEYEIFA